MLRLAEVSTGSQGAMVTILVACFAAVVAWLVFRAIAPVYQAPAAFVAFLVVLVILLA